MLTGLLDAVSSSDFVVVLWEHTKYINRPRGRQIVGFSNVKVGGKYSNKSTLKC